jgi:hypothetical protein
MPRRRPCIPAVAAAGTHPAAVSVVNSTVPTFTKGKKVRAVEFTTHGYRAAVFRSGNHRVADRPCVELRHWDAERPGRSGPGGVGGDDDG